MSSSTGFVDPYLTSQLGEGYETGAVQSGALYSSSKFQTARKGLSGVSEDRYGPVFAGDVRMLLQDGTYFTFNEVDEYGVAWVLRDMEGWWNLSDSEIPDFQRGFGDGSYDVRGRYRARVFTLSGSALVPDSTYTAAARSRLLSAFNLVKVGSWLIVDEDVYGRSAFVRLSGQPTVTVVNRRGRLDFEITLKAPDPTKYEWVSTDDDQYDGTEGYGQRLASITTYTANTLRTYPKTYPKTYSTAGGGNSGAVDVLNSGDDNVYVTLRVRGPLIGPAVITNQTTDQTITLVGPVAPATTVFASSSYYIDINTRDREAHLGQTISGVDTRLTGLARGYLEPLVDWIYLSPGPNTIFFDDEGTTAGGATLEIRWRSGWAS